jgi:2-C-methyl-D-erythritol 4-phosphate cytidylyltransferase / 2-C-methyl-D-erythritol 2,4-cyclodiphosphate synthase
MTSPLPSSKYAARTDMRIAALIVAGGKGLRAGGTIPKQFALWRGKPLLRHAAEALAASGITPIVVAIPEGFESAAGEALLGVRGVRFVSGGETRQRSVKAGLEALVDEAPDSVLIHDAARPDLPAAVIERLIVGLQAHPGAIPVLPVVDSVVRGARGMRVSAVPRDELYRVQTPQAFSFEAILDAHRAWSSEFEASDDASVAEAAGLAVALVDGDERLRKITFAADFEEIQMTALMPRTGMGFDVHRLVEGEDLWLCGVKIDHPLGLSGHSDADVAIHALVDALLGALAAGDIGDHFPPSDPQWRGAASDRFLAHAGALVGAAGMVIANVDVTIICEAPRIGPHKLAMRARLAQILGIQTGQVSVKATTTERLGLTGRGEGIAAQAVATLVAAG